MVDSSLASDSERGARYCSAGDTYKRDFFYLCKTLRSETHVNAEYFRNGNGSNHAHFSSAFESLQCHLDGFEALCCDILLVAGDYDYGDVPANGYRSLIRIAHKCCLHVLALIRYISVNKDSYLFRSYHWAMELSSYTLALGQLKSVLCYAEKLIAFGRKGELFPTEEDLDTAAVSDIQMELDALDQKAFYGRCLAFQFCESMRRPLEIVHIAMASYGENYGVSRSGILTFASSLLTSRRYVLNPELRAEKVTDVTQRADVSYCKSFWSINESEAMMFAVNLVLPVTVVNHVFELEPLELQAPSSDGVTSVTINPPTVHIGKVPLQVRLISSHFRQGQNLLPGLSSSLGDPAKNNTSPLPPSPYLIVQCHGGGFVSQSSKTHESYLRLWADRLAVPIFCIDYTLSPQAPFPRASEEVYYAYCWVMKNLHMLGSTGKKICLIGDSAGGNLLLSAMLRAVRDGVRLPDCLMAVYTPVYIQYAPSPSRILSVLDPLLPIGILTRCLEAYAENRVSKIPDVLPTPDKAAGAIRKSPADEAHDDQHDSRVHFALEADRVGNERFDASDEHHQMADTRAGSDNGTAAPLPTHARDKHKGVGLPFGAASGVAGRSPILGHTRSPSMPTLPSTRTAFGGSSISRPADSAAAVPLAEQPRRRRSSAHSPLLRFQKLRIVQDPYLSPLLAPDDVLCRLPPIHFMACELDPCLDDSVAFARKLQKLGVTIHMDVISDLPHGFMNFALVNRDCMQAVEFIGRRLRDILS